MNSRERPIVVATSSKHCCGRQLRYRLYASLDAVGSWAKLASCVVSIDDDCSFVLRMATVGSMDGIWRIPGISLAIKVQSRFRRFIKSGIGFRFNFQLGKGQRRRKAYIMHVCSLSSLLLVQVTYQGRNTSTGNYVM